MTRRGIPFVVSAPSGTGKTTVCRALVASDPGLRFSVSHTTRPPRARRARRRRLLLRLARALRRARRGRRLPRARGVRRPPLRHELRRDRRAARRGRRPAPRDRGPGRAPGARAPADARLVFLLPPSLAALEARLRGAGQRRPGGDSRAPRARAPRARGGRPVRLRRRERRARALRRRGPRGDRGRAAGRGATPRGAPRPRRRVAAWGAQLR